MTANLLASNRNKAKGAEGVRDWQLPDGELTERQSRALIAEAWATGILSAFPFVCAVLRYFQGSPLING